MSELTDYLVGENGFLFSGINNGKTIMLSGAWGAGKTHFWKNKIEPLLLDKLVKNKSACVYISLYGKDNLETIKNEILYKAYLFQNNNNEVDKITSKAISVFGFGTRILSSLSLGGMKVDSSELSNSVKNIFENKRIQKAEKYINNGGVICFDDFERKSVNIDLNDLFGFISQLSIEMNCKSIIILNSDIFEGKENNAFKQVKEKTISKFLTYSPTIDELFEVIFNNERYNILKSHKTTILEIIKESKELNARIYIQVLDNCLEWIDKGNSKSSLRALILSSINFIKNHFVFSKISLCEGSGTEIYEIFLKSKNYYEIFNFLIRRFPNLRGGSEDVIHQMRASINKREEKENNSTKTTKSDQYYHELNNEFDNNISTYEAIYFYGYYLEIEEGLTDKEFIKINEFVKSGILL